MPASQINPDAGSGRNGETANRRQGESSWQKAARPPKPKGRRWVGKTQIAAIEEQPSDH